MSESASTARWDHTATLLCQTANLHRSKNARAKTPDEFHPFRKRARRSGMTTAALHELKNHFKTTYAPPINTGDHR